MGFVRDRLRQRLATRADVTRLRDDVDRLSAQRGRPAAGAGRRLEKQVSSLLERVRDQGRRIRGAERSLAQHTFEVRLLQTDYLRIAQQLAAAETRIEWLAERLDAGELAGTGPEREQSRSLVEEIRREHEQIRVRFQVVTSYEERLGRVERTLAAFQARPVDD